MPATGERTPEPDPGVPPTFKNEGGDGNWNPTNDPPPTPSTEPKEVDAYKPPQPVPGKDDAAPTPAIGEPSSDAPAAEGNNGAATEKEGVNNGPSLLNELHKVTWRPSVERQRLTRTPTYAKAQVIRRPRQAKGEWLVVPESENIAKR